MKKISSSVDERAKSATLPKGRKTVPFVKRLQLTGLLKNSNLTNEEVDRLRSLSSEEEKWRGSFFNFLILEALLIELQNLPPEELREFVFMKKEEQETWTNKLADQKAQREQHEQQPARMHNPHKDTYASLELRLLPPVRKLLDHYAAGKGMVAAECAESIVVDALNNNPDIVKQGEQRLKEFGGNLTRAKRHAVEEKLARLHALEAGSTSHRR